VKFVKIVSLFSLAGLFAFASAPAALAGNVGGFFFPPFGKVTLNGIMVDQGPIKAAITQNAFSSSGDKHNFDTHYLMKVVVGAINNWEGSAFDLPPGASLFFTGSDFLILNPDGSTFLNVSDSPLGGNYLDMTFSNAVPTRIRESGHKFAETDEEEVRITFSSNPTLTKTSISTPPQQFSLAGTLKISFLLINNEGGPVINVPAFSGLTDNGRMRGFGGGVSQDFHFLSIKWGGTIIGDINDFFSSPL
jgi:hypothetical protein